LGMPTAQSEECGSAAAATCVSAASTSGSTITIIVAEERFGAAPYRRRRGGVARVAALSCQNDTESWELWANLFNKLVSQLI
jgi:hypothetical protein